MIAIAGGKGGCGKTTTTFGLATALADRGRSVLAVDADRDMPNLHAMAGVSNDPTIAALVEGDRTDVDEVATPIPDAPRAAVLPSAPGVDRATMRRGLRRVETAPTADVTLLDCPAGSSPAVADPIRIADRAVVVTTPTPQSLRDAAKTAALSRALGTPVVRAVVTRARTVPDGLERLVGAPAVPIPPSDDPLADPAVGRAWSAVVGTVA